MKKGTVKWFNSEKGYGFIHPSDSKDDLFVHISNIEGRQALEIGTEVEFEEGSNQKGKCAVNVAIA